MRADGEIQSDRGYDEHAQTWYEPARDLKIPTVKRRPTPKDVREAVALLSELVQVAFSQRRKILRNTLGKWLEEKGFAGDFDVQRRAEEVPVAEYLSIAASLSP